MRKKDCSSIALALVVHEHTQMLRCSIRHTVWKLSLSFPKFHCFAIWSQSQYASSLPPTSSSASLHLYLLPSVSSVPSSLGSKIESKVGTGISIFIVSLYRRDFHFSFSTQRSFTNSDYPAIQQSLSPYCLLIYCELPTKQSFSFTYSNVYSYLRLESAV